MGQFLRLRALFQRRRLDHDLDEEIQFHVSMLERKHGTQASARRRFGNPTRLKEICRDMWTFVSIERLWQDVRYAQRMLRKNPAITIVAILSLALGIGANAAMFSIVNSILLRPLPFADPERLVRITDYYPKGAAEDMRQQSRTMDIAAFTIESQFNMSGQGEAVRLPGSAVSSNLFPMLGTQPLSGRTFHAGEDRPGSDRIAVLSYKLWKTKFGGDPAAVGKAIALDGVSREVVGIMPPGFVFPSSDVQLWIPLHLDPGNEVEYWDAGYMPLIARLRPGATLAQARAEVRGLVAHVVPQFPWQMARSWNADAAVLPLRNDVVSNVRGELLVLLSAVALILLIACANVASLLLSLSAARRKEMALRSSLGASRGRVMQQLMTESVLLSLAGGALGLALAYGGLAALKSVLPADTPRLAEVTMDWRVLGFATILAVFTGLVFGLVPALHAVRLNLAGSMKAGGQQSTGAAGSRLRGILTASEVALAVVLLIGAGLLIKSLWRLTSVNPGFQRAQILTVRVSPDRSVCQQPAACIAFYNDLIHRAASVEGVLGVAATDGVPMSGEVPAVAAELEDHPFIPSQNLATVLWAGGVTPEYFRMLGVPLLRGREFTNQDGEKSEKVILVSAATARRYWPGKDPIGKHIRVVWEQEQRRVVGVVGDVRQYDLANSTPNWIGGAIYMPYPQSEGLDRQLPLTMNLLVKTVQNPSDISTELRALVASRNPNVPVGEVHTLNSVVEESTTGSRSMMWLFVAFGGVALLLAAIGTYGVISYSVSQRTYEMGVRVALGATRARIFGMVLEQSLRLVSIGLACGVVISFALTRMLVQFLYGVGATDPWTFLGVAVVLIVTALLAGYVPAWRASRVDPLKALRVD